jgi:hypothetical protein
MAGSATVVGIAVRYLGDTAGATRRNSMFKETS